MTIGQRIQQIRTQRNLSQEEFAEKLHTTRQSVSRWELDQSYPVLEKIVLISRLFSVSTDSILKDGISTFDVDIGRYFCGIYRAQTSEIVETEQFALMLYCSNDRNTIGIKLYSGYDKKKTLVAVCERDLSKEKAEYAYFVKDSNPHTAIFNSEHLAQSLNSVYDFAMKDKMRITERFEVDHSGKKLPCVKEAGIRKCLELWRARDSYTANHNSFDFHLFTGKTEYVFSIEPKKENIYCGASYNHVFDLGLFGGEQYFRIRNYADNSEPWCSAACDFTKEKPETDIPTEQCELGKCVTTKKGTLWCVKRYNDDEIVLQGCENYEYTYRRNDKCTERFI